jgi:DNA polymerase-4
MAMQKKIWDCIQLTASIGIAPNKFLAKFASDLRKPNGITEVPFDPDKIPPWLAPYPAGKIWGVGKKTEAKLLAMGIVSIGDIQKKSCAFLVDKFGTSGGDLYGLCRGLDDRQVENRGEARSISRENTFEKDTSDREQWKSTLLALAQDVARQARRSGCEGRTVVLAYRSEDFTKHSRRKTLPSPTCLANQIFATALDLTESLPKGTRLRLIGVGITGLDREMQLDLFTEDHEKASWEKSERAVDKLLEKFGDGSVVRGTDLEQSNKKAGRPAKGGGSPYGLG